MKNILKYVMTSLLLLSLFFITSCQLRKHKSEIYYEDSVLASVNGEDIYLSNFRIDLRYFMRKHSYLFDNIDYFSQVKKELLHNLIIETLIKQDIKKHKINTFLSIAKKKAQERLESYKLLSDADFMAKYFLSKKQWRIKRQTYLLMRYWFKKRLTKNLALSAKEKEDIAIQAKKNINKLNVLFYLKFMSRRKAKDAFQRLKKNQKLESIANYYGVELKKLYYQSNTRVPSLHINLTQLDKAPGYLVPIYRDHYYFLLKKASQIKEKKNILKHITENLTNEAIKKKQNKIFADWQSKALDTASITINSSVLTKENGL